MLLERLLPWMVVRLFRIRSYYKEGIKLSGVPIISDELKNLLDVEFGPEVYEIEKGMVKKFAQAIDDPNPLWERIAPPTFPTALGLEALHQKVFTAKCPLTRVLNGGNELEYYQTINIGDVISVTGKLTSLRERDGKMGRMLFMSIQLTYKNQRGEVVAEGRSTFIRY